MIKQDHYSVADRIDLPENTYLFNRIEIYLNGKKTILDIPPAMTTLDFLHQEMGMYGTKCSCNEGDCGACTVVIACWNKSKISYQAINSCIYPAAKLHGKHLITVEGLGTPQHLHPIQKALLDHHGTQCGYCTPGFVMGIFAWLANGGSSDREGIMAALEGNLCRCTGYDSILKAAEYLVREHRAKDIVPDWCRELEPTLIHFSGRAQSIVKHSDRLHPVKAYFMPATLDELFQELCDLPDPTQFRIICGGTDLIVQSNINKIYFPYLLDISLIEELQSICEHDEFVEIGATVTYSQLLHSDLIHARVPVLIQIINQIASEQIRNSATLTGNIGNASPVADAATTMLALDARLRIISAAAERYLSLADFYLDYKKTAIHPNEIIRSVIIPPLEATDHATVIKSAKRKAVDISSIVTAAYFRVSDGIIANARLAVGGADRYPRLSDAFTQFCRGKDLADDWFEEAAELAAEDFSPISDVRGSEGFRTRMIHNHALLCLRRCRDHYTGGGQ